MIMTIDLTDFETIFLLSTHGSQPILALGYKPLTSLTRWISYWLTLVRTMKLGKSTLALVANPVAALYVTKIVAGELAANRTTEHSGEDCGGSESHREVACASLKPAERILPVNVLDTWLSKSRIIQAQQDAQAYINFSPISHML